MQIGILNGTYVDSDPAFRTAYPVNLVPVPKTTGVSSGVLRPADGLVRFGSAQGDDRGGIAWNGVLYRVQGSKLVSIDSDGDETVIGDVGNNAKPVTLTYSFEKLAICSNENLFMYDGTTLTQVTDIDLGASLDVAFIDGYFMSTDGDFLIVTELGDPFSVNPLKYGSSEIDPDAIVAVLELRNEIYAINTTTIEVFDNIGGTGFPFTRIAGAQIEKGAVGTQAACVFIDVIAFVGNARNEAKAVYLAVNGRALKISTAEIDEVLAGLSAEDLSKVDVESRVDRNHEFLYVHMPTETWVYDKSATGVIGQPVWFKLSSNGKYQARGFINIYNKWVFGDPTSHQTGYTVENISSHFGVAVNWEFATDIIYNESRGAIIHELELVALGGEIALGVDPVISTEWSEDGLTWSQPRTLKMGKIGRRNKRIQWLKQGRMRDKRMQRFRGTSDAHATFARLEARIEGLSS